MEKQCRVVDVQLKQPMNGIRERPRAEEKGIDNELIKFEDEGNKKGD